MLLRILSLGALLGGAPLFSQPRAAAEPRAAGNKLVWFQLTETKQAVAGALGLPQFSADFGADYHAWQYRAAGTDHDEFSHSLVFRRSTGTLVAITRSYPEARNVDVFFPAGQTAAYCRTVEGGTDYCARVRRLSGGRALIAGGVAGPGQPTLSLVLVRETELGILFPWLVPQFDKRAGK